MPRGPRLDAPGTLHHVMIRGIEKGFNVKHDEDADLLCQLGVSASAVARMLERR